MNSNNSLSIRNIVCYLEKEESVAGTQKQIITSKYSKENNTHEIDEITITIDFITRALRIFSLISEMNIFIIDKFNCLSLNKNKEKEKFREIIFNILNVMCEHSLNEKYILTKAKEIIDFNSKHPQINYLHSASKLTENSYSIREIIFLDFSRKIETVVKLIEFLNKDESNINNKLFMEIYNCSLDNKLKKLISSFVFEIIGIIKREDDENKNKGDFQHLHEDTELKAKSGSENNNDYSSSKLSLLKAIYNRFISVGNCSFKINFVSSNKHIKQEKLYNYYKKPNADDLTPFLTFTSKESKDIFNLLFQLLKMRSMSNIFHKIIDLICLIAANNIDFIDKLLEYMTNYFVDFLSHENLNLEEKNCLQLSNAKSLNLFNCYFGVYLTSDGRSISIYTLLFLKLFSTIYIQNDNWESYTNTNAHNNYSKSKRKNKIKIGAAKSSDDDSDNIENPALLDKQTANENLFEKTFEIFVLKIIESNNQDMLLLFYCLTKQIMLLKYSPDFVISTHIQVKFFTVFSNLINSDFLDTTSKKYFFSLFEILITDSLLDFEEMKTNFICLKGKKASKEQNCKCFNCLYVNNNSKKNSIKCNRCAISTNLVLQIVEIEEKDSEEICGLCKMDKFLDEIGFPKFNPKSNMISKTLKSNKIFNDDDVDEDFTFAYEKNKNKKIKNKKILIDNKKQKKINANKNKNNKKKTKENDIDSSEKSENYYSQSNEISSEGDNSNSDREKEINQKEANGKNLFKKFLIFQENLIQKGSLFLKLSFLNFIHKASLNEIYGDNINCSFKVFLKIMLYEIKKINLIENSKEKEVMIKSNVQGIKAEYQNYLNEYYNEVILFYNKNKDKILNRIPDFVMDDSTIKTFSFYFFYVNFLFAGNVKVIDVVFNTNLSWGVRFKGIKLLEKYFNFEKTNKIFNNFDIEIYSSLLKDDSLHIRDSSLDMISSLFTNQKISQTDFLKILFENMHETSFLIRKKIIKLLINFLENTFIKYSASDYFEFDFYFKNVQLVFLNKLSDSTESAKIKILIFNFYFEAFSNIKTNHTLNSNNVEASSGYKKSNKNHELIFNILKVLIMLLRENNSSANKLQNDSYLGNSGVFGLTMASNSINSNFAYLEKIKMIFKYFYLDREEDCLNENSTNFILECLFEKYILAFKDEEKTMDIANGNKIKTAAKDKDPNENTENLLGTLNLLKIITSYTPIKDHNYFESMIFLLLENFKNSIYDNSIKQIICQIFTNMLRYFDYKAKFINNLKNSLIDLIVNKQIGVMLPALE